MIRQTVRRTPAPMRGLSGIGRAIVSGVIMAAMLCMSVAPAYAEIDPVARGLAASRMTAARDGLGNPTNVVDPKTGKTPGAGPTVITDPTSLGNLSLWIDAQQPLYTASYAAVATNGSVIGVVPDNSGNGNTPSITNSPTLVTNGINGHPAIQFGNSAYLSAASLMTAAYTNALSVYVVFKNNQASLAAEQGLVSTATPSWWLALKTAGIDHTATGVTGDPSPGAYDASEGVLAYTLGSGVARMWFNRIGHSSSAASGFNGSIWSNGVTITGGVAWTGQALQIGAIGGSFKWDGLIGEVLVFNAAHTQEQQRQVLDYLSGKWGYAAKPLVALFGNSLTSGSGSTSGATQSLSTSGDNYPSYLLSTLGAANAEVRTDAYPGRTEAQLITETPSFGDLMLRPSTGKSHIAVIWEETNTLATGASLGATKAQLKRFVAQKKAWGWKVILVTCLKRNDTVYAGFEADRLLLNADIVANYKSTYGADAVVNLDANAFLTDPTNATYWNQANKPHLTSAGYAIVAGLIAPAVQGLY